MKLFLDDIRSIPSGYEGVRSYEECIRFMKNNKGKINEISLDYDLDEIRNGYNVCEWIVNNKFFENIEEINIHSSDERNVKRMIVYLRENIPENIRISYLDNKRNLIYFN